MTVAAAPVSAPPAAVICGTSAGSNVPSAAMKVIAQVYGLVLVRLTRTSSTFDSASIAASTWAAVASYGIAAVVWPLKVSVNVPPVPECETICVSGPESKKKSRPSPPVTVSEPEPLESTSENGVPIRRSLPAPPTSVRAIWSVCDVPCSAEARPRRAASSVSLPPSASIVSESPSPRTLCAITIA